MRIAVEGCCHGELDKIYETVQYLEQANNVKVDLLLICGDFQAVRNRSDLRTMACPAKYQRLNTFYKYYSGEKEAPVLTVFIGGNHEASNYMQELPYGGWVAKNIYYMGYAGVIQIGGLRIGGLSGIYKARDYNKGHFERAPYTDDSKRSVYHIRNLEVFRFKQLTRQVDIFMSHDWPSDIARYGDMQRLFRMKPFLREEVLNGSLGSPPAAELLHKLQPSYWFSAHLHVKFSAHVQHPSGKTTKFLSLDKCLPRRKFLQVLEIPHKEEGPLQLKLDPEWLCVLRSTNHLLNLRPNSSYMPGPGCSERYNFEVSDKEIKGIQEDFGGNLTLPENFEPTAPPLYGQGSSTGSAAEVLVNPQTSLLCSMLDITDPNAVHLGIGSHGSFSSSATNPDEIAISSGDDTDDVNDDDDLPTDISSSLDVSFTNSSLDMSDSFTGRKQKILSSSFTGSTSTPKKVEIEDDDVEFRAILAAQRQKSQNSDSFTDSPSKTEEEDSAQDAEVNGCESSTSPDAAAQDDELASILAAQKQAGERSVADTSMTNMDQDLTTDSGTDADRSCDQSSSQDEDIQSKASSKAGSGTSHTDTVQSRLKTLGTTEMFEVTAGLADSKKRPSPTAAAPESSGKKLKRRNVSLYTESGEEGAVS